MTFKMTMYREMFTYDAELCRLRWHDSIRELDHKSKAVPCNVAGTLSTTHGYVVKLYGVNVSGARLIWMYHTGQHISSVALIDPADSKPDIDRLYVIPHGTKSSKFRAKGRHVVMWCRERHQYAVTHVDNNYRMTRVSHHDELYDAHCAASKGWNSISFL